VREHPRRRGHDLAPNPSRLTRHRDADLNAAVGLAARMTCRHARPCPQPVGALGRAPAWPRARPPSRVTAEAVITLPRSRDCARPQRLTRAAASTLSWAVVPPPPPSAGPTAVPGHRRRCARGRRTPGLRPAGGLLSHSRACVSDTPAVARRPRLPEAGRLPPGHRLSRPGTSPLRRPRPVRQPGLPRGGPAPPGHRRTGQFLLCIVVSGAFGSPRLTAFIWPASSWSEVSDVDLVRWSCPRRCGLTRDGGGGSSSGSVLHYLDPWARHPSKPSVSTVDNSMSWRPNSRSWGQSRRRPDRTG